MKPNTTYAVVDIETTGTSVKDGDRIIQIGCAFVKNNKIINTFAADVNPLTTVPPVIENLTGISNARVRKAPPFDDLAGTIYSLLQGTVFVAHNVNFDLPFINAELQRVGYPELPIQAVDTVSLSQILLPTSASFRLRDLSRLLNIQHQHPHAADSDAVATAHLFIFLQQRLAQLPLITLQQMVALTPELPRETAELFALALQQGKKHPSRLPKDLMVRNGIALRKKTLPQQAEGRKHPRYPLTKSQKVHLFGDDLTYRPQQARMMNQIYRHYSKAETQTNPLLIEAPTGTGKTLGYLLPLAYLANRDQQVVVSTATTVLQTQLHDQGIQLLNALLPEPVTAVVIKGNQHYVDLDRFARGLTLHEHSKQTQLLKLRVLVWLTMTTTGDLDELHLTTYQAPYFTEIAHHGVASLKADDPFFKDDFLRYRDELTAQATFIITNHAYLMQHVAQLGSRQQRPLLVLDEAQHLADGVLRESRQRFDFNFYMAAVHSLTSRIDQEHGLNLRALFAEQPQADYRLKLLDNSLRDTDLHLQQFQAALAREFVPQQKGGSQPVEITVTTEAITSFFALHNSLVKQLQTAIENCFLQFQQLNEQYQHDQSEILPTEQHVLDDFYNRMQDLRQGYDLLRLWLMPATREQRVFWITLNQWHDRGSLTLSGSLIDTKGYFKERLYPYFSAPLLTGATLFSTGKSQYVYSQLDLDAKKVEHHRLSTPFDLEKQARLLIADDATGPEQPSGKQRVAYLTRAINEIVTAAPKQTLILFNSLNMIEAVFYSLHQTDLSADRELLAQGVNGSREKLLRRFMQGDNAILLGAASFWEGIDLPQDQLELLIITQLPFESPDQTTTKARYQQLRQAKENPFYNEALPKAALKLRQGIGRLIRTDQDRGAAIILDDRLVTKRYGQTILKALPKSMPPVTGSLSKITHELQSFFKTN
ncbi:helicase C-terminal domain-containing protein [Lactiplantibacillus fabifermentans]|uniref:3'-5' exonuclease DinG n=2 Tax=Lactiplantibacillus fabifermentans TaxID=483011 RepID=A0A0R2NNU9_9LACO|nr:helicase C-terminal domain-containing protein [Lactiplantibacillus fabifermentans]ETY74304.1 diguanylate cyclase [Lactiplantibacillus fabifermentans T30PCM01]KRO27398.1 atp-dependent helicase ding [Lactiplantibacillus fabifermentans DSM 21115]